MKGSTMDVVIVMMILLIFTTCNCFHLQDQSEVIFSQCDPSSSPVALAINELGFSLSKEIGGSDNYFFSPLSISVALAMTYLGARGQTAEQMEDALGYRSQNLSSAEVHEGFQKLLTVLQSGGNEYSLLVANGMFIQENFTINEEFVEDLTEIYQSMAEFVDFSTNGERVVEEINLWVNENTQSKILKLFEEPLDPLTRLVLLNAVYFKGTWKVQFPIDETWDGKFYKSDGSRKDVELMSLREETFRYFDDPETKYKFLELPYKGEHISMLLALPRNFNAPADLVLTTDILCRVNRSMVEKEIESIVIPKFKMEYERKLKNDLIALGMRDLFSSSADLSGIRAARDLLVSNVIHKAVIEVNEEGSEAAAVSAVEMMFTSASSNPYFVANHPFQFYIIDNRSGVVLFSGRISDP